MTETTTKTQPPIFGIIGWKDSGKTTLVERLIEEFTIRGVVISAIKHAHHSFEIDHPKRDSYKFRSAGARRTAIVSRNRWAMIHELRDEEEPGLEEVIDTIGACDLILIEGYKWADFDKIEVRNPANGKPELAPDDKHIVGVAFQGEMRETGLPTFHVDDIAPIADFIARHVGLAKP
ncbi:MAG TPA: molybdopterin-guanine dinucleotide biosynthesis protein B [Rhizobiales bacterium]|nr:molybdopterin-guanine dinucleotide biosynthesis protein B [Hyphomicrobiales bacterium]